MSKKYILEFIKGASIGITILFSILGVTSVTHIVKKFIIMKMAQK